MIYLDNSATTKPDPSVLKSFEKVSSRFFANPSSVHQFGGETEKLLGKARKQVAANLNVDIDEIVFTSGGTEGNNTAIKGIALEHQNRGKHIITSEIEHPSVLEACHGLEKLGFDITYLPVNRQGIISLWELKHAIREDTILISMMHVNNEIGSIQPIKKIGELAKQHPKLFFHVDDVQGLGKVPLNLRDSGIDLCSYSGHKINGLKGTGILYVNKHTKLFPLLHGGGQEQSLRSGTENIAGAVTIARALRLMKEREPTGIKKMYSLQNNLKKQLLNLAGVQMNTPDDAAPHIINFSIPGVKPEVIIHMLGEQQVFISTKSACSSKGNDESAVLVACGFNGKRAASGFRVSLSYDTIEEEIATFINILKKSLQQFKEVLE
jgi:cysteine desulfurase